MPRLPLLLLLSLACALPAALGAPAPGAGRGAPPPLNTRPIVGLLAQEVSPTVAGIYGNHSSYIAASYVKYLEGAGARVVPIMIGREQQYYDTLLQSLNGVLFPGGGTYFDEPGGYADAGYHVFEAARRLNAGGDYFPLWGTCLGFELLTFLAAGRRELRAACDSQNEVLPLVFEPDAASSRMFAGAPEAVVRALATRNLTANFHHWCITEANMTRFGLSGEWRVLATNRDAAGLQFVSALEARRLPFYASMFHPEKNGFEWKETHRTAHDLDAVKVMQYFADFFVNEARRSLHSFRSVAEERAALIYQHAPVYTGDRTIYQQMYFFQ